MTSLRVTSAGLNIRHTPSGLTNENLFPPPLAQGEIVEQVEVSPDGKWFRVQAKQGRITREGWVASKYLVPVEAQLTEVQPSPEEPPWVVIAKREIGVRKSKPDNARIREYLATTTDLGPITAQQDETDWSSAFVNFCLTHAGYAGTDSTSARSWWNTWTGGAKSREPRYGAIAVFRHLTDGIDKGRGFVGFFMKLEGNKIYVLGGSQDGGVDIEPYARKDLIGYIYPNPLLSITAPENEEAAAPPSEGTPFLKLLPNGRLYEAGLDERLHRIAQLETLLADGDAETPHERAEIEQQINDAQRHYAQAEARARYAVPVPIQDASDAGPNPNWRRAWSWTTIDHKGRYIADPDAPFNDANMRNKPGEAQGSNIERVVTFLDVENNPRYQQQGDSTFCTVFVYDATWLLSVEIPIAPNRAANHMCSWLESITGKARGWSRLASVAEAQAYADRGYPVIATQRRAVAGHVALVRPVPLDKLPLQHNAYTAQAGALNSSLTTVGEVFGNPDNVVFYMHP